MPHSRAAGFTLIEVSIVVVLAALVVLGLVGFYVSSQATWLDASTQVLAQRDATLLVETISAAVRGAARATVSDSPDADHQTLVLYRDPAATVAFRRFFWKDSLVHAGDGPADSDLGPLVPSRALRLRFATVDTSLVRMDLIELRSASGAVVRMTSAAALYNR